FRNEADLKDKAKETRTEQLPLILCVNDSTFTLSFFYRLHGPTYDCILFPFCRPHIVFKESQFGAVMSNRGQVYNYSAILREGIEGLTALLDERQTLCRRMRAAKARKTDRGRRTRRGGRSRVL